MEANIIRHIRFINFCYLSQTDLLEILDWRNRIDIRQFMDNKQIISKKEHLTFCNSLKDRHDLMMLRVDCNGKPSGVLTLKKLDLTAGTAEVGTYYITSDHTAVICNSYADAVYHQLQLKELYGYIRKDNIQAIMSCLCKHYGKIINESNDHIYIKYKVEYDPKKFEKIKVELNL